MEGVVVGRRVVRIARGGVVLRVVVMIVVGRVVVVVVVEGGIGGMVVVVVGRRLTVLVVVVSVVVSRVVLGGGDLGAVSGRRHNCPFPSTVTHTSDPQHSLISQFPPRLEHFGLMHRVRLTFETFPPAHFCIDFDPRTV